MPRPRRLRLWVEPSLSLISFSFIANTSGSLLVDNANEMLDNTDHATNSRSVFQRAATVHLVQSETDQRLLLNIRTADRAANLLDRNGRLFSFLGRLGHRSNSLILRRR